MVFGRIFFGWPFGWRVFVGHGANGCWAYGVFCGVCEVRFVEEKVGLILFWEQRDGRHTTAGNGLVKALMK